MQKEIIAWKKNAGSDNHSTLIRTTVECKFAKSSFLEECGMQMETGYVSVKRLMKTEDDLNCRNNVFLMG